MLQSLVIPTEAESGLAVGGRIIYTGSTYLDPANLQPAPAWTRGDLGAAYTVERPDGKPVALRAQVINVGNSNYWITAGGYLSQNQPRTVMVSLSADFEIPLQHRHLTLRSARSARLEGWATARQVAHPSRRHAARGSSG